MTSSVDRTALHMKLLTLLENAQRERFKRYDLGTNGLPRWVTYERELLFCAVNTERGNLGKEFVFMQQIIDAENKALDSGDYMRLVTLHCTDLITDA